MNKNHSEVIIDLLPKLISKEKVMDLRVCLNETLQNMYGIDLSSVEIIFRDADKDATKKGLIQIRSYIPYMYGRNTVWQNKLANALMRVLKSYIELFHGDTFVRRGTSIRISYSSVVRIYDPINEKFTLKPKDKIIDPKDFQEDLEKYLEGKKTILALTQNDQLLWVTTTGHPITRIKIRYLLSLERMKDCPTGSETINKYFSGSPILQKLSLSVHESELVLIGDSEEQFKLDEIAKLIGLVQVKEPVMGK